MKAAVLNSIPGQLDIEDIDIGDLPLYDQDDDADFPAAGLRFKQQVEICDALLFITPDPLPLDALVVYSKQNLWKGHELTSVMAWQRRK